MKYLEKPVLQNVDLSVIDRVTKKGNWQEVKEPWQEAYKNYYKNQGNPWIVEPVDFGEELSQKQYALYDNRKNGGPIKKIRKREGLLCCPVCGSSTTGQVDHYLPRSVFPEFSIMRANLVPACNHCNSGVKGNTVRGEVEERFIHPYFDQWADQILWQVEFVAPFDAMKFRPIPIEGLLEYQKQIVTFHLQNVLGDQFQISMGNKWSTLPQVLIARMQNSDLTTETINQQLCEELRSVEVTDGVNSWSSAFFRGIIMNDNLIKHLSEKMLDLLA